MLPGDRPHVGKAGQYCDGMICSGCNVCADCGTRLPGTPHIETCACSEAQAHYLCPDCEVAFEQLMAEDADWTRIGERLPTE